MPTMARMGGRVQFFSEGLARIHLLWEAGCNVLHREKRMCNTTGGVSMSVSKHQLAASAYHLKPADVRKLLLAATNFRDRCLIKTLWWLGVRRHELIHLDIRVVYSYLADNSHHPKTGYHAPLSTHVGGGNVMESPLVFSQLVLIALLWLFLM